MGRRRNLGVVIIYNNEVGKHLCNFRQCKELWKHFLFMDFSQGVCMKMGR